MENEQISNSEFLEMSKNGKAVLSEEKAKWLFIRNYTFIALIPFIIYRLTFEILTNEYIKKFNYFESTISSAENYIENIVTETCIIIVLSMVFILCNFLVVFLSSRLIFEKYKISKKHLKSIMKTITIMQLIFIGVFLFYFTVGYIDDRATFVDKWRLEKLTDISANKNQEKYYIIDEYMNKINTINMARYIILLIASITCSISCIKLQKKFLEGNSV